MNKLSTFKSDPERLRKAQEIIKDMRSNGAHGPFEVIDKEDADGNLTGDVTVKDHGMRNKDRWVV